MLLLEMLEGLDFLADISPDHLRQIAALGELRELPPDKILFREGEHAYYVYVVLSGDVQLEMEVPGVGTVPMQRVGRGELLGWSPVLRLGPMTATARTLTRCRLISFNAQNVLRHCEADPVFGMEFLRRTAATISRRLSATRRRLLNLSARVGAGVA